MYDLWDERGAGELTAMQFNRAAHQHPLLVQMFQLEASLSLPEAPLSGERRAATTAEPATQDSEQAIHRAVAAADSLGTSASHPGMAVVVEDYF